MITERGLLYIPPVCWRRVLIRTAVDLRMQEDEDGEW